MSQKSKLSNVFPPLLFDNLNSAPIRSENFYVVGTMFKTWNGHETLTFFFFSNLAAIVQSSFIGKPMDFSDVSV